MVQFTNMRRDQGLAGTVRHFVADTSGATAIEYALVAGGIGVAVASTIWSLGGSVKELLYDKLPNLFG
jgi:pilus assembly protein Flp/PilA